MRTDSDGNGNLKCEQCGKYSADSLQECSYCCNHKVLDLDEDWDSGWHLAAVCERCGKNWFTNGDLLTKYKLVLKVAKCSDS